MALVRITIPVSNPDEVMEDFCYIEVWRAETKWGTYTKISTRATRPLLVTATYNYDFDDNSGAVHYWYKWRYSNSAETLFSEFFAPVQGYTPNATYCTLDHVQRIIGRGDKSKRIRFSDSYKNLGVPRGQTNTGDAALAAVSIGPSYAGIERFIIEFSSDTDFEVTVQEKDSQENRTVGTGTVSSDFAAIDSSIYINSDDWSGTAAAGDKIGFQTESHMSTDDAIAFIQDAEVLVDIIIEENIGYLEQKDTELRFDRDTVPKAVRQACARFAAFFIYTTVHNEQTIPGLPNNINDITTGLKRDNDLSTWPKQAIRYLNAWIKKQNEFYDTETGQALSRGPRWSGVKPIFDAAGVYGVGVGLRLPDVNQFYDRSQMNYDGLLDYDWLRFNEGAYSYDT